MQRINWKAASAEERRAALARPAGRSDETLKASVRSIVDDVRARGWAAVAEHGRRLDGAEPRRVPVAEGAAHARAMLATDALGAIELAAKNIRLFHDGSRPAEHAVETMPGVTVRKVWRPLDRVGLYVPGGKTPLFSSLLMLALPARAANVEELVVVTPPRVDGGLDPLIALAAELSGVEAVWTIGGAQAIAALAFGAGEIPAVSKICGPGNAYVAEAKSYVSSLPGGPSIDMPAGPSELMVIADDNADPALVAADLLSQAEHDRSAQVLLVTTSERLANAVDAELTRQGPQLPRREIVAASLQQARTLLVEDLEQATNVANLYAPEHLTLAVANAAALVPDIRNAGAVFVGYGAAETFGDYLAGSSHVLPTDGAARSWSGVSVYSFLRAMTVQEVTPEAAARMAAPAAMLARLEGLEAHAQAADARASMLPTPGEERTSAPGGGGIARLARPAILALPPVDIAAQANDLFGPDAIKLDANENPYPPLVGGALADGVNRYPEPQPATLRGAMASLYGVWPANLLVTRGGDDAIDLLVRTFCRENEDAVAVCQPTFSAYAQFARLQGARVVEARLGEDFRFDASSFVEAVQGQRNLKLAFLCSPNNPTGDPIATADVLAVADALPDTVVVLDEAYIEFSDAGSFAAEAAIRDNLVVIRTLSKAYGLAGARVGAAIGTEAVIALLARAAPPYPLPTLSIEAALTALSPSRRPLHRERIARLQADRAELAERLRAAPEVQRVREGGGNFLFLEVEDPQGLARRMQAAGVRIRFRPNAAPGGVRLTVGTPAENAAALAAFGLTPEGAPPRRGAVVRDTKETQIAVAVDLDRPGPRSIETGIPFYDHMLDQVAAHGGFALTLACKGDTEIDAHHSVEDCAIAFGQALKQALGQKAGIGRFGFALPMDEAQAQVLVDLSGRPYSRFEGAFSGSHIGDYPTEMTPHVFRSLADSLAAAIHVRVEGENDHHKTEACFKALGRALRQAVAREGDALPSTKGML